MAYTPQNNPLVSGNFNSAPQSRYQPQANVLMDRNFDPGHFAAPQAPQFKDTPQGQKFRSIFSQADQQTKAQIFNHLTNAAKAGNQRSYDQLNAIRDIVRTPAQNPVQTQGPFGNNGLLNSLSNYATQNIAQPAIRGGQVLSKLGGNIYQGQHNHIDTRQFLADTVNTGLNFAPIGAAGKAVSLVGKAGKGALVGAAIGGGQGVANAVQDHGSIGHSIGDVAAGVGVGAASGAGLSVGGAALRDALHGVQIAKQPVNNSTKSQLLNTLTHQSKSTENIASHVTPLKNLDSILNTGIKPAPIGEQGGLRGVSLGHDYTTPSGGKGNWATAMATPGEDNVKINFKTSSLKGGVANHGVESTYHGTLPVTPENVKSIEVPDAATAQKLAAKGFKTEVNPQLKAQMDLSNLHQDFTEGKNIPGEAKTPSVAQLREPGSTNLSATVAPGAKEFATQDVLPKARGAVEGVKNVVNDTKQLVTPANAGQAAHDTALAVRNYKASSANQAAIEAESGKSAFKLFNKRPDEQNIASISHFERTGQFDVAPKGQTPAEYSKLYQQTGDQAHAIKQEVYGQNRVGYIDHYVRRAGIFNFRNPGEENKAVSALLSTYKSLKPTDASVKGRTLDMPLDQAVKTLKDRGVKFSLNTTNPEQLRQLTINSAIQAKGFKDLGGDLKDQNLVKFVKPGAQVPDGLVKLNDRAFQVFFPSESGLVKAGEYYAPKEVANVLNNSASQGLEQYALYRGARNIKNNFNLVQLGLSAFHAGTTTINASLNDLTLGLRDVLSGKLGSGAKELTRGTIPGASIIRQTYLGSKAFKEFAKGSPEAAKIMEERLNPSGARLKLQAEHNTKVSQNLVKAFANGNYLGAALRAPGAIIEQSTRPIMEHLVPNAKLGAVLDRFEAVQRSMPNATDAQLKSAFAKSADSVDNIYGQLVYDNLFWNKTFKDLAMLSQRSVGWNLGTVREVGGGLTDALTKTARGKGVSDRTLFAASLPMLVGTYGAVYQYLHTGKGPETLKDYFYPKNGLTDKNGNPMRVALPSYMKDVYAYGSHPIATVEHKASPLLANVLQLAQNKNYFGDMIRNPDDSVGKQLQQVGSYLLTQLQPFSVQQQQRAQKAGSGLAQQGESFIGVTQAPGDITQTKFEKNVYNTLGKQLNTGPLTPEQQAANQAKASARQQIQQGKGSAAADQLVKQGVIKDQKGEKKFIQESQATSLQRAFQSLSPENKLKVLQNTNSTDLQKLGDLGKLRASLQKTANNKKTTSTNKRALQSVLAKLQ